MFSLKLNIFDMLVMRITNEPIQVNTSYICAEVVVLGQCHNLSNSTFIMHQLKL